MRKLSTREQIAIVAKLRRQGKVAKEIAVTLGVAEGTVHWYAKFARLTSGEWSEFMDGRITIKDAYKTAIARGSGVRKAKKSRAEKVSPRKPGNPDAGGVVAALSQEDDGLRSDAERLRLEIDQLRAEKRALEWDVNRTRRAVAFSNFARSLFHFLEKKELDFSALSRQVSVRGMHRLEAERWLALLDRYKRYIEDAMATVECDRVRTINVNKVQ